jgi:hypothetical protein
MEATNFTEMSIDLQKTIQHYILEDKTQINFFQVGSGQWSVTPFSETATFSFFAAVQDV